MESVKMMEIYRKLYQKHAKPEKLPRRGSPSKVSTERLERRTHENDAFVGKVGSQSSKNDTTGLFL